MAVKVGPIIACLLVSSLSAADPKPPKITSKTTGLYPSKACKTKIAGGEGQDPVLRCPAIKGYDVEVSFSATDTFVTVTGGKQETKFSGLVGPTLEWRLANGKPFALLVELAISDTDEEGKPIERNRHIEVIALAGTREQVPIIGETAAAKTKARIRARALADAKVIPTPPSPTK
jgi:hypothetical protein